MTNINLIKTLTAGVVLALAFYPQARAEITLSEAQRIIIGDQNVRVPGNANPYSGKQYYNDDGTIAYISGWVNQGILQYYLASYDTVEKKAIKQYAWLYMNITVNGETPSWANFSNKYATIDLDETGHIKGKYSKTGELIESYQYTTDGHMLVYNKQGDLLGVYNNFYDRHLSEYDVYDKRINLNDVDEYGDFYDYDSNGILQGVYRNNGNIEKYKYDSGGNLTTVYTNGVATYKRTSYTPAEAAAAVKKGNHNKVTLTFK